MKTEIAILGAGITGLSLAHFLKKSGKDFLVFEKEGYAGGKIKTIHKEGYTCECGPNTVQLQEEALYEIINDLGLNKTIEFANSALSKNRFVNTRNGIFKLPTSPLSIFQNNLLDSNGKWKILKDVFSNTSYSHKDISVNDYFTSKFGKNLTNNFLDPFVTGIYAGDIKKMSFKHAFPKLYRADQERGSLIRGLIVSRKNQTKNKGIFSFKNGLSELPEHIKNEIEDQLHLNSEIRQIEKLSSSNYKISYLEDSVEKEIDASLIIDTRSLDDIENSFQQKGRFPLVEYVPIISLHLGFKTQDTKHITSGFGILNSQDAQRKYLGCIYSSDIFPHVAPDSHKLYTLLIGGTRNPNYALKFDSDIQNEVVKDFCTTMKIEKTPVFIHHYSWPTAIPQYNIGHDKLEKEVEKFEMEYPNYTVLGNSIGGVSIGDCIKKAKEAANRIIDLN